MLTIVDDLVSVDNLIEDYLTAEPVNEYVQSCDIVAFNKICKLNVISLLLHSCLGTDLLSNLIGIYNASCTLHISHYY